MTEDIRLDSLEGVGPVTTKKLSGAGVHSIMDLIVRGPVEIADITGMEKDTADRIVNKAREHLEFGSEGLLKKSFESATEIYKRRQDFGKNYHWRPIALFTILSAVSHARMSGFQLDHGRLDP